MRFDIQGHGASQVHLPVRRHEQQPNGILQRQHAQGKGESGKGFEEGGFCNPHGSVALSQLRETAPG